jgi:hypothetical protein
MLIGLRTVKMKIIIFSSFPYFFIFLFSALIGKIFHWKFSYIAQNAHLLYSTRKLFKCIITFNVRFYPYKAFSRIGIPSEDGKFFQTISSTWTLQVSYYWVCCLYRINWEEMYDWQKERTKKNVLQWRIDY